MLNFCALKIVVAGSLLFPVGNFDWLREQSQQSLVRLLANVSPEGANPGAIIASPSTEKPNYRFIWVRDAALVVDTIISLYENAKNETERVYYFNLISDYIRLSRHKQLQDTASGRAEEEGLGEPKFHVDGSAFKDPWGRPQDDGPALRASALIRFSNLLIKEGRYGALADPSLPLRLVIQTDLKFTQKYWDRPGYDLWEEVKAGSHFYTRSVQKKAMLDGAIWEPNKTQADKYTLAAKAIREKIKGHWLASRGYIVSALDILEGVQNKHSGLDIETVLVALHTRHFTDDRIMATVPFIEREFDNLYPINQNRLDENGLLMAPAIGRYAVDAYNDHERDPNGHASGHPWFLSTLAMAQYYYSLANQWGRVEKIKVNDLNLDFIRRLGIENIEPHQVIRQGSEKHMTVVKNLFEKGDQYLRRVRFHSSRLGALHEQINRHTGHMQGAKELTWSHAAFLTAVWSRAAGADPFDILKF